MKQSQSTRKKWLLWGVLPILLLIAFVIYRSKVPSEPGISGATSPQAAKQEFKKQWEFRAESIDSALALGDDGTVYASTVGGSLYAVSPSGSLRWKTTVGPTHEAPAIASDGTIYLANADQTFYAIDRDGSIKWTRESGPYADKRSPWRAGALDEDKFYTTWRGSLRAVNQRDGTIAWTSGWGFEQAGSASLRPDGTLVYMARAGSRRLATRERYFGFTHLQIPYSQHKSLSQVASLPRATSFLILELQSMETEICTRRRQVRG